MVTLSPRLVHLPVFLLLLFFIDQIDSGDGWNFGDDERAGEDVVGVVGGGVDAHVVEALRRYGVN